MKKEELSLDEIKKICIENKCFSKKVFGGYIFPDGEFIKTPSNLIRQSRKGGEGVDPLLSLKTSGWMGIAITEEGRKSVYFSDKKYGGCKDSFKAALEYLNANNKNPPLAAGTRVISKEKKQKKLKLDQVGIILTQSYDNKSRATVYRFSISVKNKKRVVYIGQKHHLESALYEQRLEKAISIRDEMLKQVIEEKTFSN